jgi:Fic family protein
LSTRILAEAGEDINRQDFISTVISRLPKAYQNRLSDTLRLKRKKGLDATMEEVRQIALSERANEKMTECFAAEKPLKKEEKKKRREEG